MKKSTWFCIIALLLLSSCSHTKELVYQSIQNFSLEQGAKPTVVLDICLYNPNRYNLKLKNSNVDVFLNGANLGKMRVIGSHNAPGLDTFLLPVTLDVNPQVSMQEILQSVMGGNVQIRLAGTMRGGRHGIYIRVPVNYEGTENFMSNMK